MPSSSSTPSPLDAHLGYWLRYVSNQVSHAFSQKLAEREVTVAEWVVLRTLFDHKALSPSLLAERLGMTRGAISKLSDRLAGKGLLAVGAAGEADKRAKALALTAAGRDLVPLLAALADANDEELFGHLGAQERESIAAAMKEIVRRQGVRAVPID